MANEAFSNQHLPPAPPSKSSAPPTIANVGAHRRVLGEMEKLKVATNVQLQDMPLLIQNYINEHSLRLTELQEQHQAEADGMERSMMSGSPDEANFLCLLLELLQAQTVIEVGVFRGLTTLAMALCLEKMSKTNGKAPKIFALDVSADYCQVGQKYWKQAGVDHLIDLRIQEATQSLKELLQELGPNSVDFCFIDADKLNYDNYYETCLQLSRPGGLIVVDNTLWRGSVALEESVLTKARAVVEQTQKDDWIANVEACQAIQAINKKIHHDERIERVCFLSIADGVTICRKK